MNHLIGEKQNWLIAIFFFFCFSESLVFGENKIPIFYDMKVNIYPGRGDIAVQATLEIPRENKESRDFSFDLHETFAIKKLLVNGKEAKYSVHPCEPTFVKPASNTVVVSLPADSTQDKIQMDIEYAGHLEELPEFGAAPDQKKEMDDQINSRMVELASYSSWFPQFAFGLPLQIELDLSLPQGWISVCSGRKVKDQVKEGRAITHWSSPKDIDILICASPNYKIKSVRQGDVQIEIYYIQMPEEFIDREFQQIADVLKLYTKLLGDANIPAGSVKHVFSPKRKGQGMAGFVRPGMIVTSEGRTLDSLAQDPKFSLFQGVAHEIAHFWWHFGAGQGDWINESFAEYFSLVAVQKLSSEADFKKSLDNYLNQVRNLPADAPSLATVPFQGGWTIFIVRYYKGSLMLNQFREVLGDGKFFQACRDFFQTYREKSIGTAEFRNFWKERLADQVNVLETWLDSKGGLPNLDKEK